MAIGNIALVLLYEPATAKSRPVPVARVADARLILEVARAAVLEAQARADFLAAADDLLGEVERAEVARLQHVLEFLLPALKADTHSSRTVM
jgi:hypothetical protein